MTIPLSSIIQILQRDRFQQHEPEDKDDNTLVIDNSGLANIDNFQQHEPEDKDDNTLVIDNSGLANTNRFKQHELKLVSHKKIVQVFIIRTYF